MYIKTVVRKNHSVQAVEGTLHKHVVFTCALSNVCIFYDLHYSLLSITGPNHVSLFKVDGELSDLNSKLLLYYTPQVTH